jgi:putative RNA 2'-phosphotransferase
LELDQQGWVPITELLDAIHEQGADWSMLDRGDLVRMVSSSGKQRHEIQGERIRALYGHSVPGRIEKEPAIPPPRLFHGTSPQAWATIRSAGLRPMRRQYVHLSVEPAMAEQVGRRKSNQPVILIVDTRLAQDGGIRFWRGNDAVWLADAIPPDYLSVEPAISADDLTEAGRVENGPDVGEAG